MTRKLSVLSRVSSLAVAVGLTASAAAQSLLGTPEVTFGSVNIIEGSGTTDVSVFSPTAVVDWIPDDNLVGNFGAIAFQNSGTTATFRGFEGDFTILNRINVADGSRRIFMNGTINSFINQSVGGNVYFYSPSGFIVGSNAIINVGSLVLTASPIAVDANGGFINNGTVVFGQAPNAQSSITTVAGSQISALNEGSYVALVAPRVEHHGSINVNGAAALVGAEAATITFRPSGLFDIQVTTGTTDTNGVFVDGTIAGPASSGPGDNHRIYAVAVPKNTALTMLIANGADLGFDVAGAADVDGNAVILSAGHNVTAGLIDDQPVNASTTSNAGFDPTNVTSALFARADDTLTLSPNGIATYASDVDLRAGTMVNVFAQNGGSLNIVGDLTISTDREASTTAQSATGGTSWLLSQSGASISIGGDLNISANGVGGSSFTTGLAGGNGTGGSIIVQPFGGSINIAGSLLAEANGTGGDNNADGVGGTGRGGSISINTAADGSVLAVDGNLTAHADGFGGSGSAEVCGPCTGIGGAGIGGIAFVGTSAGTNNSVTVDGDALITADGIGGFGSLNGGSGTGGGRIALGTYGASSTFGANSTLQFNSALHLQSNGIGGSAGTGNGGNGTGGRSTTGAQAGASGGTLVVLGDALVEATGSGGGSNGSGSGGVGTGGDSDNAGNAGFMDYRGNVTVNVGATGGYSEGGIGGSAIGGQGWLEGFGADVNVDGNYFISGFAQGGTGATGGGNASGGNVYLVASNANSVVTVGGTVFLDSGAAGGSTFTGNGGNAQANLANVRAVNGGSLTIGAPFSDGGGNVFASAVGTGGDAFGPGAVAGTGGGGNVQIVSNTNGTLDITGSVIGITIGTGGYADDPTGATGDGFGGFAFLRANTGGLTRVGGAVQLIADGYGGNAVECLICGGAPGDGTGGRADALSVGTGSQLIVLNSVLLQANGYGGLSSLQLGGNGIGGRANFGGDGGGTIALTGSAELETIGIGGADFQGGTGGNGTGGTAQMFTFGTGTSSVSIGGSATLEADGFGGSVSGGANGQGGDGTGGNALIAASAGPLAITGAVQASAAGQGGDATDGAGGNGIGGSTLVAATNGSTLRFFNTLFLDGSANGGSGASGGSATGVVTLPEDELARSAASISADTGGSVQVDGATTIYAFASGGNATNGNGGNAGAGEVDIGGFVGNITLGTLDIDADATGGNGALGGNGGSAQGGNVDVVLGYTTQSVNGTISIASATVTADAFGGAGGDGLDGNFGGNGGIGGNATGGAILYAASAAGGTLNSGAAMLTAVGIGGDGGNGGNGDSGTGGNGGAGGIGSGGNIQTGSTSFNLAPTSGGGATFTTLSANSSALGGNGGNGGSAGGGDGTGGDGGDAVAGRATFLIRGIAATIDTVELSANALGGNGGTGLSFGAGGDARAGSIQVESKERFDVPGQRGSLDANSITGTAIAVGGTGAVSGVGSVIGDSYFRVLNGDATIGSFSFTIAGDVYDNSFVNSYVSVRDAIATIGDFSFTTIGELALDASNGSMDAGTINLAAGTFVVDNANPAQVGPGTYSADDFSIFTGADFITNANLVSTNSLTLSAPGLIDMRDATSTTGDLVLNAGSTVLSGNLDAAGLVNVSAPGNITTGNIGSGSSIDVLSNNGALSLGDLTAATSIDLDAPGGIVFGNAMADNFDFNSGGAVMGGNIIAGTEISGEAQGAVSLGNLSVGILIAGGAADKGFAVGMSSATSINVGNVEADESIGFATLGSLTTGNLTSGADVLALVGGNMVLGSITTPSSGSTYLADVSMFLDAGGPDNFDPALVFVATPVRSGGSIAIGGPVSTGRFQAAAGTSSRPSQSSPRLASTLMPADRL